MALLGLISWSLFVDALRLISICSFLLCSMTFSWYSFASLIAILGILRVGILLVSRLAPPYWDTVAPVVTLVAAQ